MRRSFRCCCPKAENNDTWGFMLIFYPLALLILYEEIEAFGRTSEVVDVECEDAESVDV